MIAQTISTAAFIRQQPLTVEGTVFRNRVAAKAKDAGDARQQQASDALDALRGIAESGPRERKAQAEERLKLLKEEMTALLRWGFAPGATAQRALHLAKELGSAARQFSEAVSAGRAAPSGSDAAIPGAKSSDTTIGDTAEGPVALPQAYREIMDDDLPGAAFGDRETVAGFRDAARTLKFMLDDSARKLREDGRPTAFIDQAGNLPASIDHTLFRMDDNAAGVAPD